MLHNLFQCPIELFEAYPIGRILNRLSCDMFVIGESVSISAWFFSTHDETLQTRNFLPACRDSSWFPSSVSQLLPSTAFRFGLSCLLSIRWWEILSVSCLHPLHPAHHGGLLVDTTLLQVDTKQQSIDHIFQLKEIYIFQNKTNADVLPVSCNGWRA